MINPTFQDTITLYHQHRHLDETTKRNVTEWVRMVLTDCYFGTQNVETLNGNTLSQASSYTVRIPKNDAYTEQYNGVGFSVAPGDIIVKGEVLDEISSISGVTASDVLNKYKPNSFTVRTFSDNTKIPHAAHYKVTGA